MRIHSKTLAIGGIFALILSTVGHTAYAASTCPVGFTGPGTTNICTSIETYECTVENNNQVTVNGQNAQGSVSGNASGSSAQSGTATNSNGAVFNIQVTNTGVCTAVRTVAPTPTNTIVPSGGAGATTQPQVAPSATNTPTVLANTGDEAAAWLPLIGVIAIAASALAVRFAFIAVKQ